MSVADRADEPSRFTVQAKTDDDSKTHPLAEVCSPAGVDAWDEEVMNELALFAGAGGGILGGHLLGWRTVCAVEIDAFCREVLLRRQMDGCLPRFPIWDDIRTFDGKPWRGFIDVISGGFPCQDISSAGKGAGIDGERSGLWGEMARVVREVGPRYVFVENSPMLTVRGLHRVLGDLAAMGYDAKWGVFSACSVGAPHTRERMFILAYASSLERKTRFRVHAKKRMQAIQQDHLGEVRANWMEAVSENARGFNGRTDSVDELEAIGNGQVPAVVKLAWETLHEVNE